MRQELIADGSKAAPLLAYGVTVASGVDWPSVAAMLAAAYTLLLILEKVWKWIFRPKLEAARAKAQAGE